MVFLVMFFGAMHGLFLLPVLLSLFGPGSMQTWKGTDNDDEEDEESDHGLVVGNLKLSQLEKQLALTLQPSKIIANAQYGAKGFLSAPYKAYGDEKDLGLGTSGEDSSESSSNRSQRRQATEDEKTRRRYEDGWRRSTYQNYYTNPPLPLQHQNDIFGTPVNAQVWSVRLNEHVYNNEAFNYANRKESQDIIDAPEQFSTISSVSDFARRKYRRNNSNTMDKLAVPNTGKRYHMRRNSDELLRHNYQRWHKTTPEDIYATRQPSIILPPQRSHSHHNLFYVSPPPVPTTYKFGDFF